MTLLPARAGMIPADSDADGKIRTAPRTRGDDPTAPLRSDTGAICSPHARG